MAGVIFDGFHMFLLFLRTCPIGQAVIRISRHLLDRRNQVTFTSLPTSEIVLQKHFFASYLVATCVCGFIVFQLAEYMQAIPHRTSPIVSMNQVLLCSLCSHLARVCSLIFKVVGRREGWVVITTHWSMLLGM